MALCVAATQLAGCTEPQCPPSRVKIGMVCFRRADDGGAIPGEGDANDWPVVTPDAASAAGTMADAVAPESEDGAVLIRGGAKEAGAPSAAEDGASLGSGESDGASACSPREETCNDKDDDCDQQIDEGDTTCVVTVASIAAGQMSSCAVLSNGTARCWGLNDHGQLGDGSFSDRNRPVAVMSLPRVVQLAAGSGHTCARLHDGTVQCWGQNFVGQLGNNSTTDSRLPVQAQGISRVVQVVAGANSTCALLDGGTVHCWGALGAASTLVPQRYSDLSGVSELSLSGSDGGGCARLTSGQVTCWDVGRRAVVVPGINGAVSISSGQQHACAVLSEGAVRCWNRGGDEQALAISGAAAATDAAAVVTGRTFSCARLRAGGVNCWGTDAYGELGTGMGSSAGVIPGLAVLSLAAGSAHACGLTTGGSVVCWGQNYWGAIGDGAPLHTQSYNRDSPTTVAGIP
jgi:Regulator of chromosome condensation (RCC1) repeat